MPAPFRMHKDEMEESRVKVFLFETIHPAPDHPLLQQPNFVVTPHIGANTEEALYEVGMCCARQILDVLAGKEAEYPVV